MMNVTQRNRILLLAALLLSLGWGTGTSPVHAQGGPAIVVVTPLVRQDIAAEQSFVANVRPRRRSVIGSAVFGRVEKFLVDAGQEVKAREPLAELRVRTIGIEIAAAEAELRLRRAELAELKNGSRPAEIQLAEATAQAAGAAKDYARAKFRRFESLFEKASGVSQDEYEAARAEALKAAAEFAMAESSLKLVNEGPREERIAQAAAQVAVSEQTVEGLQDRFEKYTIRAPFDGFVANELTEAGAWVNQGDLVAEVVEIDPVEVEVFVPQSSIRFVRRGMTVSIAVEALDGEQFTGTVDQIIPIADERSRTFPVRVLVPNPKVDGYARLLPGMLAKVSLPTGENKERWVVPKDALQLGGATPVVWKVVESKAVMIPVQTGPSSGASISIVPLDPSALTPGDSIIIRGNERVRPGQEVIVQP